MQAFKLKPVYKDYIWGGVKLKNNFNKDTPFARTAESWELSIHKDGESIIDGGEFDGCKLSAVLTPQMLGSRCGGKLPVLIKLIDAADNLSVQVHPSDDYAKINENDNGKTEMWYVAEAEDGAGIYCGFKKSVTKEELYQRIADGTLTEVLNFIPCVRGDSFFIPSGTVHAIGKGLTVCEVQQNSNVTYRLYDYGRTSADGRPRELHTDKALNVINLDTYSGFIKRTEHDGANYRSVIISECRYFTVREVIGKAGGNINTQSGSYSAVTVLSGSGIIAGININKGDTLFIPADVGTLSFSGDTVFLLTNN